MREETERNIKWGEKEREEKRDIKKKKDMEKETKRKKICQNRKK